MPAELITTKSGVELVLIGSADEYSDAVITFQRVGDQLYIDVYESREDVEDDSKIKASVITTVESVRDALTIA